MTRNRGHGLCNDLDLRQFRGRGSKGALLVTVVAMARNISPAKHFNCRWAWHVKLKSAATGVENKFAIEMHQEVVPVIGQGDELDCDVTFASNTA